MVTGTRIHPHELWRKIFHHRTCWPSGPRHLPMELSPSRDPSLAPSVLLPDARDLFPWIFGRPLNFWNASVQITGNPMKFEETKLNGVGYGHLGVLWWHQWFFTVFFLGDASIVWNPGNFQNGKVSDCKDRIGLVRFSNGVCLKPGGRCRFHDFPL